MEFKFKSDHSCPSSVDANLELKLDGISIGDIVSEFGIRVKAGKLTHVTLDLIPSAFEIESEAEVFVKFDGKKYKLIDTEEQ